MLVTQQSQHDTPVVTIVSYDDENARWLDYFNIDKALAAVAAHVAALPSSRTPEKHTQKVYEAGLRYFLDWSAGQLPTEDLLQGFIGHLISHKGLKPSTVNAKYLAPVRLYLRKLAGQQIRCTGAVRDFVSDCREHIRAAVAVKSPRPQETSNISPLWSPKFTRLNLTQVNAVLRSLDITTLSGMRDYAMLHIAFSTGLRIAELHRITLSAIKPAGDVYLLTVRGKRSNVDPVSLSKAAYDDLRDWVDMYNNGLEPDDPRRIGDDTPVWQPLVHGDHYTQIGVNRFDPATGMSMQSIRNVIERRTSQALGEDFKLAAHDTRRTAAAIAYDAGMPLTEIQAMLRHKDAAVTLRYVGTKPDFESRSLANYVSFG